MQSTRVASSNISFSQYSILTHLYTTEIKNEWNYTSTPPIRLHCVDRDNFAFTAYSIASGSLMLF
jgi:hypothetical protein